MQPCEACPGRGAAFFTLLRRAGTHEGDGCSVGPGSAAHHHSASKTRVNALMVLRCVRGTSNTLTALLRGLSLRAGEPQQRIVFHGLDRGKIAMRDVFRPCGGADMVRDRIQREI